MPNLRVQNAANTASPHAPRQYKYVQLRNFPSDYLATQPPYHWRAIKSLGIVLSVFEKKAFSRFQPHYGFCLYCIQRHLIYIKLLVLSSLYFSPLGNKISLLFQKVSICFFNCKIKRNNVYIESFR